MNKIALRKLICLSIVSIMIPHVNTIIAQIPAISVPRPAEMDRYDNLYQPHQPKTPYMIATPQDARIRKQNEDINIILMTTQERKNGVICLCLP